MRTAVRAPATGGPMRPPDPRTYPVGNLAELASVSVRTVHHYDEIGLLTPSGRSAANHRRYSEQDLQRLRQILFYRELGFGSTGSWGSGSATSRRSSRHPAPSDRRRWTRTPLRQRRR